MNTKNIHFLIITSIFLLPNLAKTQESINPFKYSPRSSTGNNFQERNLSSSSTNSRPNLYDRMDSFKVHIYGAVQQPGIISLEPSGRLTDALDQVGGIKDNGSEKFIELRRSKKVLQKIDLLKLKRFGDIIHNPYLQNNDVIYVPYKDSVISIKGPVKEPGVYEIDSDTTLSQAINELGFGLTPGASLSGKVCVLRYIEDQKTNICVDQTPEKLKEFVVRSGDVVFVPHKFNLNKTFDYSTDNLPTDNVSYPSFVPYVYVLGGVRNPQLVKYDPRFKVVNYVSIAGGKTRLGRKDVTIIDINNTKKLKVTIDSPVQINPGDSITIGEDKLGPEFWITLMTTVASLAVTSYAILRN